MEKCLSAIVTFIWLALLFATGIVNITHAPEVFRAFDPSRAVARESRGAILHEQLSLTAPLSIVFIRTKDYDLLAGILLAVTGCEALFAK
jgi:KUP system potassium uptake protein